MKKTTKTNLAPTNPRGSRAKAPLPRPPASVFQFALEDLYAHQDPDFIIDAMPAALAWLNFRTATSPVVVHIHAPAFTNGLAVLNISWDITELSKWDNDVTARADRMLTKRTVQREHITELAAYCLAMVAVAIFMPKRRIVEMRELLPPDFLFDNTPGALAGVEVAGRTSGGFAKLRSVRLGTPAKVIKARGRRKRERRKAILGKAERLSAMRDVKEAHLSLWCSNPSVSELIKVKP